VMMRRHRRHCRWCAPMSSTVVLAFAATLTLLLRLLLGGGPRSVINAAWNGLPVQDITNWRVPDDAGLAVLIDARASRGPDPKGTSLGPQDTRAWLVNGWCSAARLGVFQGSALSGPVTFLVDENDEGAVAHNASSSPRFTTTTTTTTLAGGAQTGRAALAQAMQDDRGFLFASASTVWLQDLRGVVFARAGTTPADRPGLHVDVACDVAMSAVLLTMAHADAGAAKKPSVTGSGSSATAAARLDGLDLAPPDNDNGHPTRHVKATSSAPLSVLAVRPTSGGHTFVDAALKCEAAMRPPTRRGRLSSRRLSPVQAADAEPILSVTCLRAALVATMPGITACPLDGTAFHPSLSVFKGDRGPAKTGLWPAAVGAGDAATAVPLAALQGSGLMEWTPGGGVCTEAADHQGGNEHAAKTTALAAVALPTGQPTTLRIRVLTMGRPTSLRRLLESLLAADYLGDPVALDFAVDAPAADAPAPLVAAHAETVAIASVFSWPHGPITVDIADKPRGLVSQWLAWHPDRDDEACLVLEDDLELSPTFYAWAQSRLAAARDVGSGEGLGDLAGDLASSRLAAISLSHQNKVVGEVGGLQMYGHTDIGRLLADGGPPAYLAQQVSSWAPILLPRPWRHFLDWWETGRLDLPTRHHLNGTKAAAPSPCLPGLASNQWWTGAPGTMWTVWWHRFAVSTGYVVLYQDPKAGPAQAVNHKEPGEHFKIKQATDGSLAGHANPPVIKVGGGGIQMAATPPTSASAPTLASLPVYDLHMRPVGTAGGSGLRALALRASIADRSSLFGGTCEWVGMADQQRARLAHEEGGRH
jgi:hypothetical protein